jgi:hypothetical protein
MKQHGWTDEMVGKMNNIATTEKGKLKTQEERNAYDSGLAAALEKAAYTGDYSGLKIFGWSESDVSKANANAIPPTNAATPENNPYSMGNYAMGLVETYTKSEGEYDLVGALNKAYENGLISAEDFAGALIQAGIDPYAQDAQSTGSGSTTLQGWVSSPNELGYGPITEDKLRKLVDSGEVTFKYDTATGKMIYKRAK